jgi:hypothetical protein
MARDSYTSFVFEMKVKELAPRNTEPGEYRQVMHTRGLSAGCYQSNTRSYGNLTTKEKLSQQPMVEVSHRNPKPSYLAYHK